MDTMTVITLLLCHYIHLIRLVDVVHQLDISNNEALIQCAVWLKRLGQVSDIAMRQVSIFDSIYSTCRQP